MEDELSYDQLIESFRALGLTPERRARVLAHISHETVGDVQGGVNSLVRALLACTETLVMPAFTYQTMVVPEYGPDGNGMAYGQATERNAQALAFSADLPADSGWRSAAEAMRSDPQTLRSIHPVLSFVAQGKWAYEVLAAQTLEDPFGPVAWLEVNGGEVLLLGVDHRDNIALHLAAQRAGRWGFVRWAVTPDEIVELQNFPGCSDGFDAIAPHLRPFTKMREVGLASARLIPIDQMLAVTETLVVQDPYRLLCSRVTCERCRAREPQ